MRGSVFKCKLHSTLFDDIPPHKPPLHVSSSPIPGIRKWPIESHSQQHVFALVDWYVKDDDKDKYGKPVEIWRKTFLPGRPSRYLPVAKFVVASTFEDKIVIAPLNRTFS